MYHRPNLRGNYGEHRMVLLGFKKPSPRAASAQHTNVRLHRQPAAPHRETEDTVSASAARD